MSDHEWIKSTLGHGETMCRKCKITNREAAILGMLNSCDVEDDPPAPEQSDAELTHLTALVAEQQRKIEEGEKAHEHVRQCLYTAEDRSRKAEDRVAALENVLDDGLRLKGGWREAITELEDYCSEPVRLKNMLAAADQLDEWAGNARSALQSADSLDLGPDWRKEVEKERDNFQSQVNTLRTDRSFWLIEWPISDNLPARWWHPEIGWCIDATKATRFLRKEDADGYRKQLRIGEHLVCTEHKMIDALGGDRFTALVAEQQRKIAELEKERDAALGNADDTYKRWVALQSSARQMKEALETLRDAVFELCEDTEEKCAREANEDLDGKIGAYARGRIREAKGIRRTIGEIARELINSTASLDLGVDWRNEAEKLAEACDALLKTPEIADCDPRDKDSETQHAERIARAALSDYRAKGGVDENA